MLRFAGLEPEEYRETDLANIEAEAKTILDLTNAKVLQQKLIDRDLKLKGFANRSD